MMLINKTESYCPDCQQNHPAEFHREKNKIYFKVNCLQSKKNILVSNNADIFLHLRKKSYFDYDKAKPSGCFLLNRVELTDACNYHCSLCYADSKPENNTIITLDKIKRIAAYLKKEKRFNVALTGGEPTLHPQLFKIIDIFKQSKLTVGMSTNGYLLAQNPQLALQLAQNGLKKCYLQFDTFNIDTHRKLRSNDYLEEKKQALTNLYKAKIKTSIISVIIQDNLHEVGDILKYVTKLGPYFGEAIFVTAIQDTGRYTLSNDLIVTKEDIIQSLIKHSGIPGISMNNFWPLPKYLPIHLNTHPDCAAILYILVRKNKIELMDNYININKFYKLLSKAQPDEKSNWIKLKGIVYLFHCIKLSKIMTLFNIIYSYLTKRGSCYINYVFIESFMAKYYQDTQRLHSCVTNYLVDENKSFSACVYNQYENKPHAYN